MLTNYGFSREKNYRLFFACLFFIGFLSSLTTYGSDFENIKKKILQPADSNYVEKFKPQALVLFNPYDDKKDSALKRGYHYTRIINLGYSLLNKEKHQFHPLLFKSSLEQLRVSLKSAILNSARQNSSKKSKAFVTLFLIGHSAPGWFFSTTNPELEAEAVVEAAAYIESIENHLNIKFANIVIDSCNSAIELKNPRTGNYFNSSARLLSYVMKDKLVIGYLGIFSDAKVTVFFRKGKKADAIPLAYFLTPVNASILYEAGKIISTVDETAPMYVEAYRVQDFHKQKVLGLIDDDASFFTVSPWGIEEDGKSEAQSLNSNDVEGEIFGDQQLSILKANILE